MKKVQRAIRTSEGKTEELPAIHVTNVKLEPAAHPTVVTDNSKKEGVVEEVQPVVNKGEKPQQVHGGLARPGKHVHSEWVKPTGDSIISGTRKDN